MGYYTKAEGRFPYQQISIITPQSNTAICIIATVFFKLVQSGAVLQATASPSDNVIIVYEFKIKTIDGIADFVFLK